MADAKPQRIEVDLLQLKDTRAGMQKDAELGLTPGIADAHGRIFRGLTFGEASESGEADASRKALLSAMQTTHHNGKVHLERAQKVIAFLDSILQRYETADDFAKLDVEKVLQQFSAAAPSPRETRPAPVRGDAA